METRQATMTATETPTPLKIEGYAIVFDTFAQVEGFTEKIESTALSETDLSDVALMYNHDTGTVPLARTPETLLLEVDEKGLKFTATLPNTESAKEIYESIKRGDLRGCSVGFKVGVDDWQGNQRTIKKIDKIFEISICPFPAYGTTSVEARNRKLEAMTMNNKKGENAKNLLRNVAGLDAAESVKTFDADNVFSSAEYRTAFYKKLQGRELSAAEQAAYKTARVEFEKRSSEFNTSTNAAALVPTDTLDEIISSVRKKGGLLAECRGFSVPSKIAIPVTTPAEKAAWHVEGAAVDSDKVTPTTVTFDGNEILKVFSISTKVQSMAIPAFENYLAQELQACVMETLEEALINGTGNGQGTGLLTVFDSDNTVTATAGANFEAILAGVGKLKSGYSNGAKFAVNNHTLWTKIYSLADNVKRPLLVQSLQTDAVSKILGFDIVVDDNVPNDVLIFGNFNYLGYNLASGIVIESSRESSFKSGLIDYRAMAIADTKPIVDEAFVKIVLA